MSKRYHVFCGDSYYPGAALSDYKGSYDSLDYALNAAKEPRPQVLAILPRRSWDWWAVVEQTEDGLIYVQKQGEPYCGWSNY